MKIKFKLQDMWIGFFWKKEHKECLQVPDEDNSMYYTWYRVWQYTGYLCLIPCFPICFTWTRTVYSAKGIR